MENEYKELSEAELDKLTEAVLNEGNPYAMFQADNSLDAQYLKNLYKKTYNIDLDTKHNG